MALSVMWMSSGHTSVQHLVMLQTNAKGVLELP